jgi:hypothetical protein
LLALAAAMALPTAATATPIYTRWGALPEATFGGTGIPNDSVAITDVFVNGTTEIILALTAHQRFDNPPVSNNGAGEYFPGAGSNCGISTDPVGCPSPDQGALWNFGYYISVTGTDPAFDDLGDFTFRLYYDFDPGADTAFGALGTVDINNALAAAGTPPAGLTVAEDSQNLLFSGFATAVPGVVTPPVYPSFNPGALGEYNFYLTFTASNLPVWSGAVGIDVNVFDSSTAVPVPGAVWLLGSALGLLAAMRRRLAVP